jgi:hypothetical protein
VLDGEGGRKGLWIDWRFLNGKKASFGAIGLRAGGRREAEGRIGGCRPGKKENVRGMIFALSGEEPRNLFDDHLYG